MIPQHQAKNHRAGQIEMGMRFAIWADQRSADTINFREVMKAFEVSRPTAYRWLAAYRASRLPVAA